MSEKHAGGRPPKYTNPEDMQEIIDRYFDDCAANRHKHMWLSSGTEPKEDYSDREFITTDEHPTISGIALVLDLDRKSILNYEKKDEFLPTIKKAKLRVEGYNEQKLHMPQCTGVIFNLKNNFGWKDKTEVEQSGNFNINMPDPDASTL